MKQNVEEIPDKTMLSVGAVFLDRTIYGSAVARMLAASSVCGGHNSESERSKEESICLAVKTLG